MREKLPFLSDNHHYAIANVAARSAQLEHWIELTIQAALVGSPQTTKYMLKNLGADRVVGLMEVVLLDRNPEAKNEIGTVMAKINKLRSERNEILHWIWGKTDNPAIALHASMRPFREAVKKTKAAVEIQALADQLF